MTTLADAPRTELGYPGGIAPTFTPGLGQGFYVDGLEVNQDLAFPANTVVYDRMRNEDGQVGSVLNAITLPILGTPWDLVGDDVRPEVLEFVRNELGLNRESSAGRRRRQGIVWREHLREALLALPFGFMPFEIWYNVDKAAPGLEDPEDPDRLYAHIAKLAPRLPRTLEEIRVKRDGGLESVVQAPRPGATGAGASQGVAIPVESLVMYVTNKEGADWTGKSVLRAAYKHWLIKDALIRLGAQIVERNGMGIPIVEYDDPAHRGAALELSKNLRAGAEAGGVMPKGCRVTLVGVSGSTADELPRVKYHDEAIGRSLLAMFLNLGHDNGARALGSTFVDYFLLAVKAVIANIEDTATEYIIRDLVELNYGPDEAYPALKAAPLSSESTPTAEALKALADAGLLTPDLELEQDVRRRYGLPAKPAPQDTGIEDAAGSPVAEVGVPALIEAGVISPDEARRMLGLDGPAPAPAPGLLPPDPTAIPDDGAVVEIPAAMASNLSANRQRIRSYLRLTTEDPLVDKLAELTERISALRAGHGQG